MKLNINSNIPKNYNTRVKTPIGHNKSKLNNLNKNIISFPTVDINNSPKSFRNNNNKIPIPKTPQLNPQMYKDMINNENLVMIYLILIYHLPVADITHSGRGSVSCLSRISNRLCSQYHLD